MLYTQLKIRRLCLRWTPAEVYFKRDLPINCLIKQHCWSVICLLLLLLWHLYPHVSCAGILYVQLLFETSDICSLCLLTNPGENNCFLRVKLSQRWATPPGYGLKSLSSPAWQKGGSVRSSCWDLCLLIIVLSCMLSRVCLMAYEAEIGFLL